MKTLLASLVAAAVVLHQVTASAAIQLDTIKLPPGFSIAVYADHVPNARSMTLAPDGTVFVGSMRGSVSAIVDRDHDGRADELVKIADGLRTPNGVAFKDGALYVADVSRVIRYDAALDFVKQPASSRKSLTPVVVYDKLPTDAHHGWKYLSFGPDGLLYLQVGAPCNICEPSDPYASIIRMKPDGTGLEIIARGVRNSVGQAWHPDTKELWFTDNGRDNLGDDVPSDELNHLTRVGEHFGYPFCHAGTIADPEYGNKRPCSDFTPPAMRLGPHVAAIGMKFYTGTMFPQEYRKQIFIAEHGSWNRSTPIGYRISVVRLEGGKAVKYETFADGWLQGRGAWGRPADVLVMPDGALLVSDDTSNAVYRISYRPPA
ncbi:MAG TPA: PQQ-dependent sugar dehydrogenase [Vicinamibacterales bacterium]|nr:PQQ-dependent sugar dehydrogenase [Vicinamibacterales bacterium]